MQSFLVRTVAVIAGQQIALVGNFAGQDIAVEALLPGDVVDGFLDGGNLLVQGLVLAGEHLLARGDGGHALEAERKVFFHLGNREVAVLETVEALDPAEVVLVKDAMVVLVALDMGDESLVAVELQRLVFHIGGFADLLHSIYRHDEINSVR